ncbi:response regulator [Tropicimonas sp. TH_r6]|uniref:response regulator n=1 Tax=Tropicimonas sp. TH_r6 TaxID=3082085 RepID=UPI0029530209|nr:response regulator [Tropicimonas sp. TH_r6]MDV7144504.1 response regulator [Tropicimonas sp. TH_r6]
MPQIVIADDNLEFANYVATVCRREGWSVETCENGAILLETLRMGSGPALVLVDVNMPEMDGIEAIEWIVDVDRPLRLRFVTGGSDAPIVAAKMIASARDLAVGYNVFKPLRKEELQALLKEEAEKLAAMGVAQT